MSECTKTFSYQADGLSYTVTVYEVDGEFFADISVSEGSMDVNAIYTADSDMSGDSASLGGALNMNGGGSTFEGESIQWDDALKLSDPGLGPDGTDKDTCVSEGETLTVELTNITSIDDIEFFGIRATSTSTDEGSIKGVSEEECPPDDPDDPTYEKVMFVENYNDSGVPIGGFAVFGDAPAENPWGVPVLPDDLEPTFENYLQFYLDSGGEVSSLQGIEFYDLDENGDPIDLFSLKPADGETWETVDDVLTAYDNAIAEMEAEDALGALMFVDNSQPLPLDEGVEDEVDLELI